MGMPWSRLKQMVEARLAPALEGRVQFQISRYRHAHDEEGRGWIAVDKEEIASFCYFRSSRARSILAREAVEAALPAGETVRAGMPGTADAWRWAGEIAERQGWLTREGFVAALESYLSLSIDAALAAQNVLIRSVAVLDRRLGKRRLPALLANAEKEHPLVRELIELRCSAEGVTAKEGSSAAGR